jgi:hypothetical protein
MPGLDVISTPYLQGGRELCQTGCALLLRGQGNVLSDAIEFWSSFSHCAPIVRFDDVLGRDDTPSLIEALAGGPTPGYVGEAYNAYEGEVYLFVPDGLTPEVQRRFRVAAFNRCLKRIKYDLAGLVENAVTHTEEKGGDAPEFCSVYYDLDLKDSGLVRLPSHQDKVAPRPGDIPVWWGGQLYKLLQPFLA